MDENICTSKILREKLQNTKKQLADTVICGQIFSAPNELST